MTQGMSGLELEAGLPFGCPEFRLRSGQSMMGHLTGVLSPFLNCDLGTGAWEIAEAPPGSHTMQAASSTSPWPFLHCSHIPFPSTLTCAGCQTVSTLLGTRALCVSSKGPEAEWKAAYLCPERGPALRSEAGLAGFSFCGAVESAPEWELCGGFVGGRTGSRLWVFENECPVGKLSSRGGGRHTGCSKGLCLSCFCRKSSTVPKGGR